MSTCRIVGGGPLMGWGAWIVPGSGLPSMRRGKGRERRGSPILCAPMRFASVRLDSFAHHLPEAVLSSAEIERRLAPLYGRLQLSEGRLELMSGIRERR